MKLDIANKIVYIRQSWLNDLAICPERARLGIVRPEFRIGSDATIIGTAMHHGIESVLGGSASSREEMLQAVSGKFDELAKQPYKVTNIDGDKIPDYLASMTEAFYEGILPEVELGGEVEKFFRVPLGIVVQGYAVWLEGTMDYLTPSGVIWDWKTASKAYYAKEKQKSAIQPTVYTYAVAFERKDIENVGFNYGVMVRGDVPKHQIVSISRNEAHHNWLKHSVGGALHSALATSTQRNWVMNDSSALCSANWCSYWSVCKGAFNMND